jgi:anthranilate phosphoribosyltransferase
MLRSFLTPLLAGENLSLNQSTQLFELIIQEERDPVLLSAILSALKVRGETADEMAGAAMALLKHAAPFPRPDYDFADIVGTGGDAYNTINISTASAITAAACGFKVAKHGSSGVSSLTGASDVLTQLGINVQLSAERARKALDDIGLCFLFAPQYHAGMRHARAVRQALKTPTIFNLLGPLVNPARPSKHLMGVYHPKFIQPAIDTLHRLGVPHAAVIHGAGLDEVGLHGVTQVAELQSDHIEHYTLTASDFGLPAHPISAIKGGDPATNAQLLQALLNGSGAPAHVDAVAANVALLMRLFGHRQLKDNVERVKIVLSSGAPYQTLLQLQQASLPSS